MQGTGSHFREFEVVEDAICRFGISVGLFMAFGREAAATLACRGMRELRMDHCPDILGAIFSGVS